MLSFPVLETRAATTSDLTSWTNAVSIALVTARNVWVALTSVAAVDPAVRSLAESQLLEATRSRFRWAAVGPTTAAALRERGIEPVVVAPSGGGASLAAAIVDAVGEAERVRFGAHEFLDGDADAFDWLVLHPGARSVRPELREGVQRAGGEILELPVYENVPIADLDVSRLLIENARQPITIAAFASPSAGAALIASTTPRQRAWLQTIPALAIGSTTAQALGELGFARIGVAASPDPEDILAATCALLDR